MVDWGSRSERLGDWPSEPRSYGKGRGEKKKGQGKTKVYGEGLGSGGANHASPG